MAIKATKTKGEPIAKPKKPMGKQMSPSDIGMGMPFIKATVKVSKKPKKK